MWFTSVNKQSMFSRAWEKLPSAKRSRPRAWISTGISPTRLTTKRKHFLLRGNHDYDFENENNGNLKHFRNSVATSEVNDAIVQTDQRIVFPGSQKPSASSVRKVQFDLESSDASVYTTRHAWSQTAFDLHHKSVQVRFGMLKVYFSWN